jgi:hypothetical protein
VGADRDWRPVDFHMVQRIDQFFRMGVTHAPFRRNIGSERERKVNGTRPIGFPPSDACGLTAFAELHPDWWPLTNASLMHALCQIMSDGAFGKGAERFPESVEIPVITKI